MLQSVWLVGAGALLAGIAILGLLLERFGLGRYMTLSVLLGLAAGGVALAVWDVPFLPAAKWSGGGIGSATVDVVLPASRQSSWAERTVTGGERVIAQPEGAQRGPVPAGRETMAEPPRQPPVDVAAKPDKETVAVAASAAAPASVPIATPAPVVSAPAAPAQEAPAVDAAAREEIRRLSEQLARMEAAEALRIRQLQAAEAAAKEAAATAAALAAAASQPPPAPPAWRETLQQPVVPPPPSAPLAAPFAPTAPVTSQTEAPTQVAKVASATADTPSPVVMATSEPAATAATGVATALKQRMAAGIKDKAFVLERLPGKEVVQGQPGTYYRIILQNPVDAKRFSFDGGSYDLGGKEPQLEQAMAVLRTQILSALPAALDPKLYAQGFASASKFNRPLKIAPGDSGLANILFLPKQAGSDAYLREPSRQVVSGNFANTDLPNLRGAYVAQWLAKSTSLPLQVLEGGIKTGPDTPQSRGFDLMLFVGW